MVRSTRKPQDKNAPKKPLSAYFMWVGENRDSYKTNNPNMGMPEITKLMGKTWHSLSDEAKKPYKETANTARDNYQKQKDEYVGSADFKRHQHVLAEWKRTESGKPFMADPNRPKEAPTAFDLFIIQNRSKLTELDHDVAKTNRIAVRMYNAQDEDDKKSYNRRAAQCKSKRHDFAFVWSIEHENEILEYERSELHKKYLAEKAAHEGTAEEAGEEGAVGDETGNVEDAGVANVGEIEKAGENAEEVRSSEETETVVDGNPGYDQHQVEENGNEKGDESPNEETAEKEISNEEDIGEEQVNEEAKKEEKPNEEETAKEETMEEETPKEETMEEESPKEETPKKKSKNAMSKSPKKKADSPKKKAKKVSNSPKKKKASNSPEKKAKKASDSPKKKAKKTDKVKVSPKKKASPKKKQKSSKKKASPKKKQKSPKKKAKKASNSPKKKAKDSPKKKAKNSPKKKSKNSPKKKAKNSPKKKAKDSPKKKANKDGKSGASKSQKRKSAVSKKSRSRSRSVKRTRINSP